MLYVCLTVYLLGEVRSWLGVVGSAVLFATFHSWGAEGHFSLGHRAAKTLTKNLNEDRAPPHSGDRFGLYLLCKLDILGK